jgi:YVTN family beta-propeller protein
MYIQIGVRLAALLIISCLTLGALSSPLQRLYVANEGSDSISVIDPSMGSVITRVPTGPHPHNVNVDPSEDITTSPTMRVMPFRSLM